MRSTFSGHTIPPESNSEFTAHEEFESRKQLEVSLASDRAGGWSVGHRWCMVLRRDNEERAIQPRRRRGFSCHSYDHVAVVVFKLRGREHKWRIDLRHALAAIPAMMTMGRAMH